ncbi:MAG: sigma-70 family RNA polymerase sigma factor [Microthrixaceae bacterium]
MPGSVDGGEQLASLEAWSMTVSLNWCRQQMRRRGAEKRALQRVDSPGSVETTSGALADDVKEAVLALPQRQREVAVLHYLLDLGVDPIAEIVGSSSGAVRNALFHARASLARRLGPTHAREGASRERHR